MNDNIGIIKSINKILIIILIILLTTIIRLYPLYQYSFDPAGYGGLIQYSQNQILYTGYAQLSDRGEILLNIYEIMKMLIFNINKPLMLLITSLFLSLSFSMVILLYAKKASEKTNIGLLPIAIIIAFSVSATGDIITRLSGWNGSYIWILYLLSFYIIIFKKLSPKYLLLSLVLVLIIPIFYFTESLFVASILIVSIIYQIIFKKSVFPKLYVIIFLIVYFTCEMYLSKFSLNYVNQISTMFGSYLVDNSRNQVLKYIALGSTSSMIRNGVSLLCAYLPLGLFIIIDKRHIKNKIIDFLYILIIAYLSLTIIFYLWMGVSGILQRVPLQIALVSIIALSILAVSSNKNIQRITLIMGFLSILISSYAYIVSDYNSSGISFDESYGAKWLMKYTIKENIIFTDLRLSGPLIENGYSPVIINDGNLEPQEVNMLLEQIFYEKGSPVSGFNELNNIIGKNIEYAFFSSRYSERFPGIKGYDYSYLPAPIGYLEQYNRLNNFNIIYVNNESNIMLL